MCIIVAEKAMLKQYQVLSLFVNSICCFHEILKHVQFAGFLTLKQPLTSATAQNLYFALERCFKRGKFHPFVAVETSCLKSSILFSRVNGK